MMDATSAWTGQDPTLSLASQDDFQQFLDMGNHLGDLNFDFQEFNGQQGAPMMRQDGGEAMDMRMDAGHGGIGQHDTIMQEHIPMTTASNHASIPGTPLTHGHPSNDSLSDLDAQIQYLQQQRHQQQQRQIQDQQRNYFSQNRPIPPTPNSMEIHASNSQQFYPQSDPQQQAMYERYQMQVKEQEMAFTPLVSPAVTPLETHFNIPEYTVPGAYFSPLSSPALHAQNEHSSVYEQMQHPGTTNSPIDINLDNHSAPGSSSILSKKPSRKNCNKPRNTRATIRQSPIVKPQRKRKGGSTTAMSPQTLSHRIEPANTKKGQSTAAASSAASTENSNSENGSISPEHLSDMAPPPIPKPGSAGRSPYITAHRDGGRSQAFPLGSPATPASLMRITKSPNSTNNNADIDDHAMGGFALPEPATDLGKPPVSRIDTQSDGQTTPTLGSTAAKTPGFQPLPSPAFAQPKLAASASQSPQIEAMNGGPIRKTPLLAARGSKKRGSVSSVQVSPALRPRISPSIKPLLPGGGSVSNDTASLLLASKSNYQNILEGTHLPGVSYPTELSTNLTSKRTSHKIAEQGRRNRINSALQEIATLLPKGPGKDSGGEKSGDAGDNGDAKGSGTAAQSANSKASTVEHAIEFIKLLKKQVEDTERRAADAERRAEEAEKQLTELRT